MPAIGPQQWKQVRSVLDELDTVPCGQRRERLAAMQIDDHQVLAEIESLLDAESRQSGFLESSPYAGVDPAVAKPSLAPGTVLGAFRIDSLIGRGGMAEV
jgi:serine/threonine-protein kinase